MQKSLKEYILPTFTVLAVITAITIGGVGFVNKESDRVGLRVTPHVVIEIQDSANTICPHCGWPSTLYIYKRVLIPDNGTNNSK